MSPAHELETENLERDIEATRQALGDTVEALAQKTDVRARAAATAERARQHPGPLLGVVAAVLVALLVVRWLKGRSQ